MTLPKIQDNEKYPLPQIIIIKYYKVHTHSSGVDSVMEKKSNDVTGS